MSTSYDNENDEVSLPGFRFHPTDEELVGFYLKGKVEKKRFFIDLIRQIDIYNLDPADLPKIFNSGGEWYFFYMPGKNCRDSIRPNRGTGSGFWKATDIDEPICSVKETHKCIGLKTSLVYHRGRVGEGIATDWMMHEFRLPPHGNTANLPIAKNITRAAEVWRVCRIFKNSAPYNKYASDWQENNKSSTDWSSKTFSLNSDNCGQYVNFRDLIAQPNERQTIFGQAGEINHDAYSFQVDNGEHYVNFNGSVSQQDEIQPILGQVDDRNHETFFLPYANGEQYVNERELVIGQVDARNHDFMGQLNTTGEYPFTASDLNFGNPNGDGFLTNVNWP